MAASYKRGVEFIAANDEAEETDVEDIAGYVSTITLAVAFGKSNDEVAQDVLNVRLGIKPEPRPSASYDEIVARLADVSQGGARWVRPRWVGVQGTTQAIGRKLARLAEEGRIEKAHTAAGPVYRSYP